MKTYRVPVIHHVTFGCEVEVKAENIDEAKRQALNPNAEIANGAGYNWDRMNFKRATLGDWQAVEVVEESGMTKTLTPATV